MYRWARGGRQQPGWHEAQATPSTCVAVPGRARGISRCRFGRVAFLGAEPGVWHFGIPGWSILSSPEVEFELNLATAPMYRIPVPRLISQRLANGLAKRNFGRWYQNMMMESHLHLVTALLLSVAIMALVELIFDQSAPGLTRLAWLAVLATFVLVAMKALRNYFFFMMWAERVANQAVCSACGTYGRLRLVRESGQRCEVACKRCGNEWSIEEPDGQ